MQDFLTGGFFVEGLSLEGEDLIRPEQCSGRAFDQWLRGRAAVAEIELEPGAELRKECDVAGAKVTGIGGEGGLRVEPVAAAVGGGSAFSGGRDRAARLGTVAPGGLALTFRSYRPVVGGRVFWLSVL